MLEIVNEDIFVTKGDTGTVFISPKNEDGTPYYLFINRAFLFNFMRYHCLGMEGSSFLWT